MNLNSTFFVSAVSELRNVIIIVSQKQREIIFAPFEMTRIRRETNVRQNCVERIEKFGKLGDIFARVACRVNFHKKERAAEDFTRHALFCERRTDGFIPVPAFLEKAAYRFVSDKAECFL